MKRLVLFLVLVLSALAWSPALAGGPTLSSLRVSPATVAGGGTVRVTVNLSSSALSGGALVELSSNSSYAMVDETVRVPSGKKSVTFDVVTRSTSSSRSAILTATYGGVDKSATIKINALALSSVSVSPSLLTSDSEVTGTVRLNGKAPSGGYRVDLVSADTSKIDVPSGVTVLAGKTSATFVVSADPITAASTVAVTADALGVEKIVNVKVAPLAITRLSGSSAVTGGNASSARITLNGRTATGGAVVTLASSQPSFLTVPASFTVQPGVATQTFSFTTASTTVERTIIVTATYRGVVKSYSVVLKPVAVSAVTVSPTTLVSTQGATATVKLTGPAPSGGLVVALSDDSTNLSTDPSVSFLAGEMTATAPITTTFVSSSRPVVVSASLGGVAKTVRITLVPVTVSSIVPRSSPIGGNDTSLVITLNANAPTGGVVVELTSANPNVISFPATVTVLEGQKTLTVTYRPAVVAADTAVAIGARHLGVSKPASVAVKAARLSSLALSASTTTGGRLVDATITLTGPAPSSGLTVNLDTVLDATSVGTVNPFVSPPATVLVPAGARSVTFSLTTMAVTAKTVVRLTTSTSADNDLAKLTVDAAVFQDVNPRPLTVAPSGTSPMTIRLSGIAPAGGVLVNLTSTKPEVATVPTSVTIPAGSRSVNVNVTGASGALTGTSTTIRATALGKTIDTVANVSSLTLSNVTLSVTDVIGGNELTGTVTLSAVAPVGGLSVGLTVSDETLTIPANVVVAVNQSTATFTIKTPLVQTTKNVVVTGRLGGSERTANLAVRALAPTTLVLGASAIDAGQATTGTLSLNGTTPSSSSMDVVAAISVSPAKVIFPATVEFARNASTVTFNVTGVAVSTDTLVTVSATVNGETVTATLTVRAAGVQSVSFSSAEVVGGSPNTGTVTLTSPAPVGGKVVSLTSSNAAASVPSTVTVSAGTLSATFAITTTPVASDTTPVITATLGSSSANASFIVTSSLLKSLSVNDADLEGGFANATGTVTLEAAAPVAGTSVTLTSSVPGAASVPATVTVLAGQTTATFNITSSLVASDAPVTITATKGVARTQLITVRSIKVSDLTLSKASTQGGTTFTATVTINRAVKSTGVNVIIASNNPAIAGTTVLVPINATTATVTLTTAAVSSDQIVAITASFNGGTAAKNITVLAPAVTSVTASPATLVGGSATSTGTVTISHAAPAGFVVALNASNGGASVPTNVTFTVGSTTATFPITTSVVENDRAVTITAARNGVTKTTEIVVEPLIVSVIEIDPTSVMGGASATGTLTLNGLAPAGGAEVTLSSDTTDYATVPATVTIPAGAESVTFPVTTFSKATRNPDVTISMTYNGRTKSADLVVEAPAPASLSIPATVVGGSQVTATVTLNSAAAAGQTLTISSDNGIAIPPATVPVTAGLTTATFPINTGAVLTDTTVTLTVSGNGVSKTAPLTVTAPNLTALTIGGDSVLGGGSLAVTATISSPAPAAGLTIAVTASPARTSAISIGIAPGAMSGSATFTTQGVLADTLVTLTGSFDGVPQSDTFMILRTTVASISTNVASVTGGNTFEFTVTLNGAAPVGGMSITGIDTSGNIAMPSTIVVLEGATSATITVTTSDVATDQTKQVGVRFDGVDRFVDIILLA